MDYTGNYIYQNAKLSFILTDKGRILPDSSGFAYEYFIKDHLGNTRVIVQDSAGTDIAAVMSEANYYPFGLQINALSYTNPLQKVTNKYLYNGKELQDDFGLGWLDYGKRFYDAEVGRFTSIDPLAEKYSFQSPYTYAGNNPVKFVDRDGEEKEDWFVNEKTGDVIYMKGVKDKTLTDENGNKVWHNFASDEELKGADYNGEKITEDIVAIGMDSKEADSFLTKNGFEKTEILTIEETTTTASFMEEPTMTVSTKQTDSKIVKSRVSYSKKDGKFNEKKIISSNVPIDINGLKIKRSIIEIERPIRQQKQLQNTDFVYPLQSLLRSLGQLH